MPTRTRGSPACASRAASHALSPSSTTRSKAWRWLPAPSRPPEGVTNESSPAAGSMARRLSRGSTPGQAGHLLDRPLHRERGLGRSEAPVRARRGLVGDDAGHRHLGDGDVVRAGQAAPRHERRGRAGDEDLTRADVGGDVAAHGADAALAVVGRLHVHPLLPGVDRGHEVLGAVLDPAHRPAGAHRQPRHDDVLRVLVQLAPEPSADVRDDDPDAGLAQPEHHGQGRSGGCAGSAPMPTPSAGRSGSRRRCRGSPSGSATVVACGTSCARRRARRRPGRPRARPPGGPSACCRASRRRAAGRRRPAPSSTETRTGSSS